MDTQDPEALTRRLSDIERGIRKTAHDISNPLGIIRMAVYFLQNANPDEAKRKEYFQLLDQSIGRIDDYLKQLRALTDTGEGAKNGTKTS